MRYLASSARTIVATGLLLAAGLLPVAAQTPGLKPGKGSGVDDSVKSVKPTVPPKGNKAGATAIEYGKTAKPDAKPPSNGM